MDSFLEKCVDQILKSHKRGLGEICLVLPNRRAGLFIKKYFSKKISAPVFMPGIFSIEDFITRLSGLNILDHLNLLFEFYEVHKEVSGKENADFEAFADWAPSALRDFNEVDEYLVKASSLFSFLTDARAIELWDPGNAQLTDFEKNYLQFYRSLHDYYKKLNNRLLQKKQAYPGAAYRYVAENINELTAKTGYEQVYFIGFNALTNAEEKLIKRLLEINKARVFWDADQYYLGSLHQGIRQEAGKFLREHLNKKYFGGDGFIGDDFHSAKEIEIIGVPQNIGQAKICGELIRNMPDLDKLDLTAVVLADESMLIPVLNSIPGEIKKLNITMGFPLEHVPLFHLFDKLFQMNRNASGIKQVRANNITRYYLKDILQLLQQPVLQSGAGSLFGLNAREYASLVEEIIRSNKVLMEQEEMISYFPAKRNEFTKLLFRDWKDQPETALTSIFAIIDHIRKSISGKGKKEELLLEYLYSFALIFRRLKSLQENYNSLSSAESLWKVLKQLIRTANIPFYGEPLQGLQLMGMLETRTLDFENIILLSCNEGILPSARSHDSFIPFDIKIKFGLPTYRDRDAIFAYHFYRLLQRAKKAYLLYNTEAGQLGGGDKSRFLSQLEKELPQYNPSVKISQKIYSLDISGMSLKSEINIEKTTEVMERIHAKAKSGFSASSLNKFRRCPLQFYFSELAGLKEEEETGESIDAASLGTIIHKSLQELYQEYRGEELDVNALQSIRKKVRARLDESFSALFPGGDADFGKNLLIMKAAEKLIRNVTYFDEGAVREGRMRILELEQEIRTSVNFNIPELPENILLKGFIDRIDEMDGMTRLLDYKTGVVEVRELTVRSDADTTDAGFSDIAFQLMFYAFIFTLQDDNPTSTLQSAVLSLKKSKDALLALSIDKNKYLNSEALGFFKHQLSELLQKLFDSNEKISQTRDIKTCQYCSFKNICNR
ncbi:MAG: PD-(D/E)XK nuclease family protein [Bacteroidota bacterium]|nr:PD-(D/E)XK nuclease family protein [Bacteroidota bacterium]